MKKVLSVVLALLLLLPALSVPASATTPDNHTHVYDDEYWAFPTCTEGGYKERFCLYCSYSYGVDLKPLGHHFPLPWKTIKEPTCTEDGIEHNVCQRTSIKGVVCGHEWYRPIPALGHDFGQWYVAKEATAAEEGIERRDCSRCDAFEIRPLAYVPGEDDETSIALCLEAHFTNLPEGGYCADDTASISYTVTNTGTQTLPILAVYLDSESFPNGRFGTWTWEYPTDLAPGESYTSSFSVDLLACSDWEALGNTLAMTVHATTPIDGADVRNGEVRAEDVFLSAPVRVEDYSIKITYAYALQEKYDSDDVVVYNYCVRNTGSKPLYDVLARPEYDEYGDVLPTRFNAIGTLQPGESRDLRAEVDLTKLEFLPVDHFGVTIRATGCQVHGLNETDPALEVYDSYDVTVGIADYEEESGMEMCIAKYEVSSPACEHNTTFYTPGEEVVFNIEVWNCANYPLYDVNVYDDLDGTLLISLPVMEAHTSAGAEYRYRVTYDDVGKEINWDDETGTYLPSAYLENSAHVIWNNGEADPETGELHTEITYSETVMCPLGLINSEVLINKREISTPANGAFYTPGETIRYRITVTENLGETWEQFGVYDMNHDGDVITFIDDSVLGPYETLEFEYSYEVRPEVITAEGFDGYIYNLAGEYHYSAAANDHLGDVIEYLSNLVTSPAGMETETDAVVLTKTEISMPENRSFYVTGETVSYSIEAENVSDHTVYDLEISDPIKGSNEDAVIDLGITLDPQQSVSYVYSRTVTEEDALLGFVLNYATGWYYDSGRDEYVTVTSNDVVVPVDLNEPQYEELPVVHKYLLNAPANGVCFVPGETVKLGFAIENDTDKDYVDASIYDDFIGIADYWTVVEGIEVPAHSVTPEYVIEIPVDINDADRETGLSDEGSFVGTVKGTSVTDRVSSLPVYVPTGRDTTQSEQQVLVSKQILNAPANGSRYTQGEVIHYAVTVTNASGAELQNITLTDNMFNSAMDEYITLASNCGYSANASYPYLYSYTVTAEDVECGAIYNIANLWYEAAFDGNESRSFCACSDAVTAFTGPGMLEEKGPVPYMFKYVSNTPANGVFFTEGEEIEFTLCVVNTTGCDAHDLKMYDVLSGASDLSVPCETTVAADGIASATMKYKVTEFDTDFFDRITNTAWAELDNDIAVFAVYSNECEAPIGEGTPAPAAGMGPYCSHILTSYADGVVSYATHLCTSHASTERAARKVIDSAADDKSLESAYEVAAKLWMNALTEEYEELIASCDEVRADALNADLLAFEAWYEKYVRTLDGQNAARIAYETVRSRCCELCCMAGTAPNVPAECVDTDKLGSNDVPAQKCEALVKGDDYHYTETYVADAKLCAVRKKLNAQLNDASNETEAARAWQSAVSVGLTMMTQLTNEAAAGKDNEARIASIMEQNSFKMMLNAKRTLLEAFYPDAPDIVNELLSNHVLNEVCIRMSAE